MVTLLEFFQAQRFRAMRAAMFAGLGLWGVVPAFHGWFLNHGSIAVRQSVGYNLLMGAVYLVRTASWLVDTCFKKPPLSRGYGLKDSRLAKIRHLRMI